MQEAEKKEAVCVCYREFVYVWGRHARSRSSVKDRHMISIRVLHLFLLLLSSVFLSLTKLWLWIEVPELELQSSPSQSLINQANFYSGWWMAELGVSWLNAPQLTQCIRAERGKMHINAYFLPLFPCLFLCFCGAHMPGQSSWIISHA